MAGDPGVKDYLLSLVAFAKSVDLEEVVWEKEGRRIAFRRRLNGSGPVSAEAAPSAPAAPGNGSASVVPKTAFVTSPMVGTFWRAVSKDRPPLVVEGGEVSAGQRVAVVEAMKIPKDVISPLSGRIINILVENGKPVEYGQKLFEVEVSKVD